MVQMLACGVTRRVVGRGRLSLIITYAKTFSHHRLLNQLSFNSTQTPRIQLFRTTLNSTGATFSSFSSPVRGQGPFPSPVLLYLRHLLCRLHLRYLCLPPVFHPNRRRRRRARPSAISRPGDFRRRRRRVVRRRRINHHHSHCFRLRTRRPSRAR